MTDVALPELDGFKFRKFKGPEDFEPMAEVQAASLVVDGIEETCSPEEIAAEINFSKDFDPTVDIVMAEAGGQLVGYAKASSNVNDEGQWIYWQSGFVLPAWRHKGLGRALLGFTEARSRAQAEGRPVDAPHLLRGIGEDTALGKIALFEQGGYGVIRYYFFMIRQGLDELPEVTLPAGFEFRPATPEDDRKIWEAKEEAFRDHWGHTTKTDADYQTWFHSPFRQPEHWPVIWDVARNEVAAMSLNCIVEEENATFGFKRGSINHLGVRRPYRGQGLGRAVLLKGMEIFRQHGMTEAVLGVDSENPSGALGLYERNGFTVLNKDALYQKAVTI